MSQFEVLSFVTIWVFESSQFDFIGFVTTWVFEFSHIFGLVTISVFKLSHFQFFSFVRILVFICYNLSFQVLSHFLYIFLGKKYFCLRKNLVKEIGKKNLWGIIVFGQKSLSGRKVFFGFLGLVTIWHSRGHFSHRP